MYNDLDILVLPAGDLAIFTAASGRNTDLVRRVARLRPDVIQNIVMMYGREFMFQSQIWWVFYALSMPMRLIKHVRGKNNGLGGSWFKLKEVA